MVVLMLVLSGVYVSIVAFKDQTHTDIHSGQSQAHCSQVTKD